MFEARPVGAGVDLVERLHRRDRGTHRLAQESDVVARQRQIGQWVFRQRAVAGHHTRGLEFDQAQPVQLGQILEMTAPLAAAERDGVPASETACLVVLDGTRGTLDLDPAQVVRKHFETAEGSDAPRDTVALILDGEIDLIVNTPFGTGGRLDGYEIRTAAVTRGVPCITTVQGLAATVQGIEALIKGETGVRSLQEWATDLAALRAAQASSGTGSSDTTGSSTSEGGAR